MTRVATRPRSILSACLEALRRLSDPDLRTLAEAVVAEIRSRQARAQIDPQPAVGAVLLLGVVAEARPRPTSFEVAQLAFLHLDDRGRRAFVTWAEKVQP